MDGPFSLMPPSGSPEGSEAFAQELAAFIMPYLEEHADVFGGIWLDTIGSGRVACFVGFTDDLTPHRAALDHRVQLISSRFAAHELEAIREPVQAFVEQYDGAKFRRAEFDERTNRIVVGVETVDPDALRDALRPEFGDMATVEVHRFVTRFTPFDAWSLDGDELTVHWIGGNSERGHRLDVVERDDAVRVTVLFEQFEGHRSPGGLDMSASATLSAPLAGRPVVDATSADARPEYASPTALHFGNDDADWEEVEPPLPAGPISEEEMLASAARAGELARDVRDYVRRYASWVYGGMWTERHAGGVLLCVAFSEDARGHRAELDPAIKVLRCEYPIVELEQMQRDVAALIEATPGCTWSSSQLSVSEGTIDVFASADDLPGLQRLLAGHFGACVRLVPLDSPTHEPTPTPFEAWMGDEDTRFLAVVWSNAAGGPAFLQITEYDDDVRVTVIESRPLPGTRAQSIEGRKAVATAHLRRPLAGRRIVDVTTGESPPRMDLPDVAPAAAPGAKD